MTIVKILIHSFAGALGVFFLAIQIVSAQSTAFTYQGRLLDNGVPANGDYDFQFTVYDAATDGNAIGATLTNSAVAVSNGLFAVTLDFGGVFDGSARWLEIGERPSRRFG